jgi:3-hydroxyacyl-[acyl-carrier-protein] dehydratase
MLLNSFFTLENLTAQSNVLSAVVIIKKEHPIFEGHFPGEPIVPGVCMMQMIKEITEVSEKRKLRVQEASNMKFLSVIDPRVHETVQASVTVESRDEEIVKISASLFAGDVTFFKLKAAFKSA